MDKLKAILFFLAIKTEAARIKNVKISKETNENYEEFHNGDYDDVSE